MKSKKTLYSVMSQKTMPQKQQWKLQLSDELQRMKRPFLTRVEYSKLKIESKIQHFKNQKKVLMQYEDLIQILIMKFLQNQLPPREEEKENTESSEYYPTEKTIKPLDSKNNKQLFEDDSEDEKESEVIGEGHFAEWHGRDKERVFKNSTNMQEQFDRVFKKKLGLSQTTKKHSYSYRKQQKLMLQRVYNDLKDPKNNFITFKQIFNLFSSCKLFFTVYGISQAELEDIVSCSAHTYPDKLTEEEFYELFLVNSVARTYDELDNRVNRSCCMEEVNWKELRNIFNQLDTFGSGTVNSRQFFHKMKTISASKELLQCKVINFTNIGRHYTFSKVLFDLEHKRQLPENISWTELQNEIINFSHIQHPTLDQIMAKQIKTATIVSNETNTFLLKEEILKLLKEQFLRCPKFSYHFAKCKYFCQELLNLETVISRSKELVRHCPNGKGFINLLTNIRMLLLQGPEYFDMDEMLTYFSVKGFQDQIKHEKLRKTFDAQSTTSQEEWEEKRKQQRRVKRMKSLEHMDKIMKNINESKPEKENKVPSFRPVQIEQFNLTKPRGHMTIRERKVKQMIEEKQTKQLSEIKSFIPANPIPASINGQKYLETKNRQRAKRQLQKLKRQKQRDEDERKIKHLMSNTKLFEKRNHFLIEEEKRKYLSPQMKHQFEAKPISWFIKESNLLEMIQSEKEEKRKNRLRETKEKYVFGYWKNMPYQQSESNFKKMTITKNLETCRNTDESLHIELDKVQKGENQKTSKPKTTVVPDFNKLQKQFIQELESKKKMRSPTVIREFNLSVSKKKEPQIIDQKVIKKVSPPKKSEKNPENKESQKPVIVGTTKKYESMVELAQQKMSLEKNKAELEKLEQKDRKKKQKIFARFMRKAMDIESQKQKTESLKSTRRKDQQQSIEHQSQLKKMYERVLNRPFLFQTACESHQIKKKGRKGSKHGKRKEQPKKVKIPVEQCDQRGYSITLPLNYIQEEQLDYQDREYDQGDDDGQFIVRDFDRDEGQEEYDVVNEDEEETQRHYMRRQIQQSFHLNQQF